jgi:hypothetical protein
MGCEIVVRDTMGTKKEWVIDMKDGEQVWNTDM